MDKNTVIKQMREEKVIAIARGITTEQCVHVAKALYDGGIRFMEVTFDASGKVPDEETAGAITAIKEAMGEKMHVGAGTVLTAEQAEIAYRAGAEYIISPDVNEMVIRKTCELGMISIPGAMTPTEAMTAYHYGADFVKIFPAGNLGSCYIKAIRAPLNQIALMAVGGVSADNIKEFLAVGCAGAGIGGNLVSKKLIENGNYAALTETARQTVAAAKE